MDSTRTVSAETTTAPPPPHCIAARLVMSALVALAVTGVPAEAAAQAPSRPDSVVRVSPLRVDAVRTTTTAGAASALLVDLDSLRPAPAATLEQVLRELPLVTVRTNSRGEAQFSLRGSGSDARQVAVLIDGIPLHVGWDDRVDLSVMSAGAASNLTLVRGLPSILHGPNVLGGVVEMAASSRGAVRRAGPSVTGDLAVEQTGGMSTSATASIPFAMGSGDASVRIGGGYRDRTGVALSGDVVEAASSLPESPITGERLRANTDHTQTNAFLTGRFESAEGRWMSFSSTAFRANRGIAAELHSESPRFWRYPDVRRAVTVLSAGTGDRDSPLGGRGDIETSVGVDVGHTEIDSYTDATYSEIADTEDADDRTLSLRLLSDQTLARSGELRLALTYIDTRHDEVISGSERASYRQRLWSAGAETAWRIATRTRHFPSVRLSIGGAVDGADTPESGDKPPLSALREWGARVGITSTTANGALLLHGGVSRRARFPALRELYSGALGRFEPNPALSPESLYAAETGFTWSTAAVEVQGVGFLRRLDGAIEQIRLPDLRRQRVNLGAVTSAGLELMVASRIGPLGVSADVTMQNVRLSGQGDERERPEYQPSLIAGVQSRVALPLDVTTMVDARYVGRQYCLDPNASGEIALDGRARMDFSAARSFGRRTDGGSRLEVRVAADNVFDSAIYDQCGLPQPGRTLRLQVSVR